MARKASEHVYGPYAGKLIAGHRSYRVVELDGRGGRGSTSFTGADARERATAYITKQREALSGRKVSEAIVSYLDELKERGNRPSGIESTGCRLRTFFQVGTGNGGLLSAVTAARSRALLEAARVRVRKVWIRGGHMGRKKVGQRDVERPRSVTYRAGMLAEVQTFATWCAEQGWLALDKGKTPLDGLEVRGKRKKGKTQLRLDEVALWESTALREYDDRGDLRALASVLTFYFGNRAIETLNLKARDIDRGGREAVIDDSKTESGRRRVEIPEHLIPRLADLRAGKLPEAPLFPSVTVDQLLRTTKRLCKLAGVTVVTTQSLRGLHSTVADEIGVTGPMIARQLGHADAGQVSEAHYSAPGSRQRAAQRRVFAVVNGGKA